MEALQVRVRLVLRVPVAVLGERPRLAAHVAARAIGAPGALVDVVAHEQHQVEPLGGEVPVRGEEPVLEVLA